MFDLMSLTCLVPIKAMNYLRYDPKSPGLTQLPYLNVRIRTELIQDETFWMNEAKLTDYLLSRFE
ncbi:hypothetical protein ACTXT7_007814 [Hymenolepis weldensis]